MGNRVYDLEFQKDAVRLLYKRNGKATEVARSLGIPGSTLRTWGKKLKNQIRSEEPVKRKSKDERILELEEEVRKLKKESADYQEESIILKKSISIFLKRPLT
jgi:transposase-like protein